MKKEYIKTAIVGLIISGGISYGLSDFFPFLKVFSIILVILSGLWYWFHDKKGSLEDNTEQLGQALVESDKVIQEKETVIKDYEDILDSLVARLPCACGETMFDGLFAPNMENFVECDACKSKYKIMVSFDSILLTEPLDNNKIIPQLEKEIEF